MEVSSLLKELHCPYKSLVSGPISQRLLDVPSRNVLLDFLCTELQAARLLQCKTKKKHTLEIEMDDSTTATSLMKVMEILGIPKELAENPDSVLPEIEKKVNEKVSKRPELISEPAFKASLTEKQWAGLENLFEEFEADYTVRRELLITRLDVTIQSFQWGEGSKGKEHGIVDAYVSLRNKLKKHPSVKLTDVLAARESIFIIEKTSSAELVKNTKSHLNRVLIPAVPDRGGRPKEQRPPVEMPNWMKRSPGGAGGGRGDRHGGGWRGQGKKFRGGHGHKSGGKW
ncbi:protein FAM98B-like isoform X2 [Stegodyphus dumicola]|nr:protein FAM98B-like isoform X2 [Stegodyphus dumicola]